MRKLFDKFVLSLVACTCVSITSGVYAAEERVSLQCGQEGVWVQILGAGGGELNDRQASASYLLWIDDKARVLVNTAAGSSVLFDQSGARFEDLDAIIYNNLSPDLAVDLPAFIQGSRDAARDRPLPIIGPDGGEASVDTKLFVNRLIGPNGAFPELADFLTYKSSGGYKITTRDVPATGRRRWARFGAENLRLSAIPVNHAGVPSIAWRADIGQQRVVFTGPFNNAKDMVADFAKDADVLVVPLSIPETARGAAREAFVIPSQIGQLAARANVRMVVLGHRTNRTRGRESRAREAIEQSFTGPLIFANDLECWGL